MSKMWHNFLGNIYTNTCMMTDKDDLNRFVDAQEYDYDAALREIKRGRKTGHWMWYVFPQIQGLGLSATSRLYAIRDMAEATAYLKHPVLGRRLVEISSELLKLATNDAVVVLGGIDSLKLKSSMTLFVLVENADTVFQMVLDKFFGGERDAKTIAMIG